MILKETASSIKPEVTLLASKLKNMNLHLRELLSKKLRIELEIKNLKKSIAEKQLHVKKQVKVKAVIESVEFPLSEQQTQQLLLEDPDLYFILREIDITEKVLKEILDQFSENQ